MGLRSTLLVAAFTSLAGGCYSQDSSQADLGLDMVACSPSCFCSGTQPLPFCDCSSSDVCDRDPLKDCFKKCQDNRDCPAGLPCIALTSPINRPMTICYNGAGYCSVGWGWSELTKTSNCMSANVLAEPYEIHFPPRPKVFWDARGYSLVYCEFGCEGSRPHAACRTAPVDASTLPDAGRD